MKRNCSVVSLNASCFKRENGNWMKITCNGMKKFLPDMKSVEELDNMENNIGLLRGLLDWMSTWKGGWTINGSVLSPGDVSGN